LESPCIDVCQLDPLAGLCIGCGRTVAEITAWARLTPEQRREIMAELPARLADLKSVPA
jgi:predicted Fe-S protein YdhL (DUF1289 family)